MMTMERLQEARESLCGWSGCIDCQLLREAIAEIERLQVKNERLIEVIEWIDER
jgi:hypothetical protein